MSERIACFLKKSFVFCASMLVFSVDAKTLEVMIPALSSAAKNEEFCEFTPPGNTAKRFSDIVGSEKIKAALHGAVRTLTKGGQGGVKSALIKGSPGCGKTLLAQAVAGEAGAGIMRVRIAEDMISRDPEADIIGLRNKVDLTVAKAKAVSRATGRGVVLLVDNLHLALSDYMISPVIRDMSSMGSYSAARSRFRNSMIRALERLDESEDKVVLISCASDMERWEKPYPKEFEPVVDHRLEEKFQEILAVQDLSEAEVGQLVEKQVNDRDLMLDVGFEKKDVASKLVGLSPKMIGNFVGRACQLATLEGRIFVKVKDFDLSVLEESGGGEAVIKASLKGRDLIGPGTKVFSAGEVETNFSNTILPPGLTSELELLVSFIKEPAKFEAVGAKVPMGTMLFGEAGNGKTTLARAVAGQAAASFVEVDCSKFMGRYSDLFSLASKLPKPAIIFLDGMDSVGKENMMGMFGPNPLKKFLDEMDMAKSGSEGGVTVLGSAKSLSPFAQDYFKVGRFEKIFEIEPPCEKAIHALIGEFVKKQKISLNDQVCLKKVARGAMGLTREQLFLMVNRSAVLASCDNRAEIQTSDLETARSVVMKDSELLKSVKDDSSSGPSRGDEKFFQSPGRFYPPNTLGSGFKDVAGCSQAKQQLQEIVSYLSDPEKFKKCGAKVPCGVLMTGEPGTGKTLLARAVAGEAGCPFISVSASKFDDMYVGVGKNRVEALFKQARRYSPCLVFIDEIDAVGRRRDTDRSRGCDQTINQLLSEMDGFERSDSTVVVIAATNRPDTLDSAIKRSGRFDRKVVVDLPDLAAREEILGIHSKKIQLGSDVALQIIAKASVGFSGADLETLINEAALRANRDGRLVVSHDDLEWARDFVYMGAENRSLMKSKAALRETAYHEAGHALIRLLEKDSSPLHKVTIVPRGFALGLTWAMDDEDVKKGGKASFLAEMRVAMGGRAAEELIFDEQFAGVYNDLEKANKIAKNMVRKYGMSDLGPISLDDQSSKIESQDTKRKIDKEIRGLVNKAYKEALEMLKKHKDALVKLSETLLEKETLSADQVREIVNL